MLQGVKGGYKTSQKVTRVTGSERVLQGLTEGYKGLQRMKRGYRRLQGVTRVTGGYKKLQKVTRGYNK